MKMSALVIVDVQKAMDHPKWGERSTPCAEENMAKLLKFWRAKGWPVFHIKDCSIDPTSPYAPGQPLHDFKDEVKPIEGEYIIQKSTGNAFIGTNFEEQLKAADIERLTVMGVHIQYCVDAVVRTARYLGFDVTLVSDATVATAVTSKSGKILNAEEVHSYTLGLLESHMTTMSTAEIVELL